MSFQQFPSGGETLELFSRSGERTPLKSLQNGIQPSTEPMNVKSKSITSSKPWKYAKVIVALDDVLQNIPASTVMFAQSSDEQSHSTEELDIKPATYNFSNVTLKSYECDGGEVDISDELVEKDDTIPLPQPGLSEHSQHVQQTLDLTNMADGTDDRNDEEEKTDHLYHKRESCPASVPSTDEILPNGQTNAHHNITLKYLNCTGGEIEIANSIHLDDQTIPLPTNQRGNYVESYIADDDVDSIVFTEEVDHIDHLYCETKPVDNFHVTNEVSVLEVLKDKDLTIKEVDYKDVSLSNSKMDTESFNGSIEAASFVSEEQKQLAFSILLKETDNNMEENNTLNESLKEIEAVIASPPEVVSSLPSTCQQVAQEKSSLDFNSMALSQNSSHDVHHKTTSAPSNPEVEEGISDSQVYSSIPPILDTDTIDSALGSSANVPALPESTEAPRAEALQHVFKAISECTPLQLKYLTPIVRRASLAYEQAKKELAVDKFVTDCVKSEDKSLEHPIGHDHAEFWHLDSPISRPLFNSTELVHRSQPCIVTEANEVVALAQPGTNDKPVLDVPVIPEGPLQQQLRQMAEFLILASGKMDPAHVSAPAASLPKAQCQDVSVATTPMKMVNHSINTSGQFEKKRSFSVVDQSTLTDPLLWNVSMGSLENVPRPELEQHLLSSMIIVEALVQQLAAARASSLPPSGAALSELRERAVQTKHTELSQTSMHRDLYLEALKRIGELEMDASSLQNLVQNMHNVKMNMAVLTSDTDAALCQMKQFGEIVREDNSNLVSDYSQMKSLMARSRESQVRMMQKVKIALQQKADMHSQMEQAFSDKEAANSVMDQLRKHCSREISDLEKCVGSQQELLAALHKSHPEQIALNKAHIETLNSASELLSKTTEEQSSLAKELCTVRGLLQKCTPILQRLNKKADAAVRERDKQITERDCAIQDKEQTEEKLNQALQSLQTAKEQISDYNLQVTILTSEMVVLRQKLSKSDEERAQLDRKATDLSATLSSTLASYAFLEQALASETTKLQQSWADVKQVKDRAQDLESSLVQSEQRVRELSPALAHREEQVSQLQALSRTQALQLQQLQERCSQLGGVREENEFLQMENEMTREQVAESECLLRANLQSLRERNIQCEDLNAELRTLQNSKENLQEELERVKNQLATGRMEQEEKLDQIVTEVAILHHTVRGMTNELHASVKEENSDEPSAHHISSNFLDSAVGVEETPRPTFSDAAEDQSDLVFSESSAFTRITAVTPKKRLTPERDPAEEQQHSNVMKLLDGLDATVTELQDTMASVQQRKDTRMREQRDVICGLQRALEAANCTHRTEVSELQDELNGLKARMEKATVNLQQKAQYGKTISKLVGEINDIQVLLDKHKADNNELRREVVVLRRALQQSQSEADFLQNDLKKHSGHLAPDIVDEKIALVKEIAKLKRNLQDEMMARNKLLERAKRHQYIYQANQQKGEKELQMLSNVFSKVRKTLLSLPASVKKCEQLQQLIEYVG